MIKLNSAALNIDQGTDAYNKNAYVQGGGNKASTTGNGFFSNLGSTVARAAVATPKVAYNAFVKPTADLAGKVLNEYSFGGAYRGGKQLFKEAEVRTAWEINTKLYSSKRISKKEFVQRQQKLQADYDQHVKEMKAYNADLPTAGEAVKDAAQVALTAATFGAGTLGKNAVENLAIKGLSGTPIAGVPMQAGAAAGRLVDGVIGSGATLGKSAITQATGKAARLAILGQPTLDLAAGIPGKASSGNYGGAALDAGLLATGGLKNPIGALQAGAGKVGNVTKQLVYGKQSLFDQIKTKDGSSLADYYIALQKKVESGSLKGKVLQNAKRELDELDVSHQYMLDQTNGDVPAALKELVEHYSARPFQVLNGKEISKDFRYFQRAQNKVNAGVEAGKITPEDGFVARAGRFSGESKAQLFKTLDGKPDARSRVEWAQRLAETSQWGKNPIVSEAIFNAVTQPDWKKALNKVISTRPLEAKSAGLPRGYFPIQVKESKIRANFKSIDEVTDKVGKTTNAKIPLLGATLRKVGVSTETASYRAYADIAQKGVDKINDLGITSIKAGEIEGKGTIGSQVIQRLNKVAEGKYGVSDLRQLTISEIEDELGLSMEQAQKIRRSLDNAFLESSLGERGLGNKIQDINFKFNPLARKYSRIQGALRYELNPFFRAQEIVETLVLGAAQTGSAKGVASQMPVARFIFGKNPQPTIEAMENAGFLRGGAFGSYSSDGAFISTKLTKTNKRMLAGLMDDMAANRGMSVDDLLKDNQVREMVRSIVQYPTKGFLGSNAARTLNLAVFPFSYNLKVAKLAGDALAKQPAVVQVAIIKGAYDFNTWLGTDEGIKFQRDNSEAIGLFKYFTPVGSITSVYKALGGEGMPHVGDFGAIGGLPFGVISQIIEHHGVYDTDRPYLNPKTGEVVPEQIPANLKASGLLIMTDIINSLFNYPGRIVGLGSKKSLVQGVIPAELKEGTEYTDKVRTDLSEKQKSTQRVLSGGGAAAQTIKMPTISGTYSPTNKLNNIFDTPVAGAAKPAKAKKQPAWVNGYKTRTARPIK